MAEETARRPSIDFYFDFSSPYGYIASHRIEAIADRHRRRVVWHPILLGQIFRAIGTQPLVSQPLKGEYARLDIERSAKIHGVPFQLPTRFPTPSRPAVAAFYAVQQTDPERAVALAKMVYTAYFVQGRDINSPEVIASLGAEVGEDRLALLAKIERGDTNKLADAATEEAKTRGVFGSPFVIADSEPFWGADRLDLLDRWLEHGRW